MAASSSKRTIEFVLKASDGGYSSTVRKAADATKDAADKAKDATKATEGLGMAASGAATPLAAMVNAARSYASDAEKATTATAKLSAAQRAAQGDFDGVAKGLAIVGGAAVLGLGMATKASIEFNKEMSNVHAAMYGSTDDTVQNFTKLREAALTSGAAFGYSARDSAAAANELIRAGRSASDVVGGELKASLAMAAADNMDLAQATSIMAAQMTVFASSGATAASVADTLAAGAGVAQGGISELGEALKYVGANAAASGMDLQETTGLLATLANNGIQGSMAGTSLAGVLRNLKTPTAAAKKAMEEIGLETYNAAGEFKGMTPLLEELGGKLDGLSDKDRDRLLSKIFDVTALNAAIPLLNEATTATEDGSNALRDMQEAVGQTGYAAEQAARQTDNLAGDWQKLTGSMEQAFIASTTSSDNMVRSLVQGATKVVDGYNAMPSAAKNAVTLVTAGMGAISLGTAGLIETVKFGEKAAGALEAVGVSAQRAGALVKGAGILMGGVGIALTAGLAIYGMYAESVQRAEERTQALADTFSVVEGKAQATQATIQLLTDTMSAPQADFEIFGKKGLAGAFEQLNAQADKLNLKDFGLDVAGAAKAISGSQKDYDAYIASLDQLAEKQVATQRANTRTKDSWDALHPTVQTYQQQNENLAATLGTAGQQTEQVKKRLESMREEYQAGALVAEQMKASTNALGTEFTTLGQAQDAAAASFNPLELGTQDVAQSAQQAQQAIEALIQSMYSWRDAQSGMMSDQSAFEASIDSVAAAFAERDNSMLAGADILDLNTQATREANDAMRTIADSARNYAGTLIEQGTSQATANMQMELAAAAIMEQGRALGLSEEQLTQFAATLTGIPAETVATLTVDGARQSIDEATQLEDVLQGVPAETRADIITSVMADDMAALKANIETLPPETQLDVLTTLDSQGFEGARAELDSLVSAFAQQLSIDVSGMDAESAIAAVRAGLEDLSDKQLTLSAEDGITPVAGSAKSAVDILADASIVLTGEDLISGPAANAKASRDALTDHSITFRGIDAVSAPAAIAKTSRDALTDKSITLSAADGISGTAYAAKAAVDAIPSYKSVTIEAFRVGNFSMTASAYADGGAVVQGLASGGHPFSRNPKDLAVTGGPSRGAGTGTSDDIPTMLSNGEHVWTAREVDQVGGHDQMYRMRALARAGLLPRFASGGAVKVAGRALDEWARLTGDKEDRLQLEVKIDGLYKSLWGPAKEQETDPLKRNLAREQYDKARAQLVAMDQANWLDRQWAIKDRIAAEDAKLKAKDEAARAAEKKRDADAAAAKRMGDRRDDFQTDVRRGDFAEQITSGGGLRAVDTLREWSKDADFSAEKQKQAAAAATQFEGQLMRVYAQAEAAREQVKSLQSIYDDVANSLSGYQLTTEAELVQSIDAKGNVWHTKPETTAASMAADAAGRAAKLKTFAGKLASLVESGASPALAQQVAALGPDEGIAVADAFLKDPASMGTMNAALKDIDQWSGAAGQAVTEASAQGGLAFAKQVETQLGRTIEALADQLGRTFADLLGVKAPAPMVPTADLFANVAKKDASGGISSKSPYAPVVAAQGQSAVQPVTQYNFNGVSIKPGSSEEVEVIAKFVAMMSRNQGRA